MSDIRETFLNHKDIPLYLNQYLITLHNIQNDIEAIVYVDVC